MQRCNAIGWLNRHQFEERWMQLLGVVNQPPPPEGTPQEEGHAHMINVCAGVQAVTSLLLNANLRPSPGDPISSIPLHTHRNSDVLFLGSRYRNGLFTTTYRITKYCSLIFWRLIHCADIIASALHLCFVATYLTFEAFVHLVQGSSTWLRKGLGMRLLI